MAEDFNCDPDLVTLADARSWLREQLDEGATCPCCSQFARIYRRKLTSTATRALIALYRTNTEDFEHLPTVVRWRTPDVAHQGGYVSLAGYWGLMEEERVRREDGGRAGYWRITDLGARWLNKETIVPKYVRLYDGRVLGFDGELVSVVDSLGTRFDYTELMGR